MTYCTQQDVKDLFGNNNVVKWADLDNDQDATKISDRIDRAIAWADNEIDSLLRQSVYAIPFVAPVPLDIKNVSATLAGVNLYENRGIQDFDPETGKAVHRLIYHKERAYKTIRQILARQRHLDAPTIVDCVPK